MIKIVLSPREKSMPGGVLLVPALSVAAALLASALLLALTGTDPWLALKGLFVGAFGDWYAISETIVKTTPLLLCGLGVTVAFTMNLWNIGAEGQFYAGAIGSAWVVLTFPDLPAVTMIPAMVVAGMIGGALWALGPALLKAKLQVNEIITTLMMNYVALYLLDFFVYGPWKDPVSFGFPVSPVFADAAWLPSLGTTRVHLGLLFGVAAILVIWVILGRTRLGFTMRVIGSNREAARLSGMPIAKVIIISLCLSGAFAGLAGMSEITGIQHRLQPRISPGYGYTAIIIAWLARLNPWATLAVSFLFGGLLVGGEVLQMTMKLPASVSFVIQGLVLFFVLAGEFMAAYRIRVVRGDDNG